MATSEEITQFFEAVKSGNLDGVKTLVELNNQYLNCRTEDEWSYTGLHWASQKGYLDIVNYLLDKNADYTIEAKKVPWRPMLLAARYGHKSIVETFLNVGENIDIQILCDSRYTALHCTNTQFLTAIDACHHGYPDIVKLLIDKRASIGLVSGYGLRPIHTAANNGHAACVGLLLQAGEDIDVTHLSDWKYTPLHWACQEGKTEVVKLLLEHKANIHVKCGKTPQTALQIAQKNPTQNAEIISLLQQQELKEVQNSHYKVFALFQEHFSPLLRKRLVHLRNISSLEKFKESLHGELGLQHAVSEYNMEYYIEEFDDFADLDDYREIPGTVKIRLTPVVNNSISAMV